MQVLLICFSAQFIMLVYLGAYKDANVIRLGIECEMLRMKVASFAFTLLFFIYYLLNMERMAYAVRLDRYLKRLNAGLLA